MARKLLKPMTSSDLAKALTVLELVRGDGTIATEEAAAMFDVSPRSIQYWLRIESPKGERERRIPNSVAALIRLLVDGRIERNELGPA